MKDAEPPDSSRLEPSVRRSLGERLAAADGADDAVIARVKARILRAINCGQQSRHDTVRASELEWETVAPGIERKLIHAAGAGYPSFWRLAPDTFVPTHFHDKDEECLVLEGSVRIDDLLLHAGDFHLAHKGTSHQTVTTTTGAVLYVRGTPASLLNV